MKRRARVLRLATGVALACALTAASARGPVPLALVAHRFAFDRAEITVARGEVVALELHSRDALHGFAVPALGIRSDIVPGQPALVRFIAPRPGRYVFLCDVFCGDGHARMRGVLVVTH